jgi:hypothetical protein
MMHWAGLISRRNGHADILRECVLENAMPMPTTLKMTKQSER